jgi:hypothetical protein
MRGKEQGEGGREGEEGSRESEGGRERGRDGEERDKHGHTRAVPAVEEAAAPTRTSWRKTMSSSLESAPYTSSHRTPAGLGFRIFWFSSYKLATHA